MIIGQLAALVGAFTWALGSVLLTRVNRKAGVLAVGTIRYLSATLFFWLLLPVAGQWRGMADLGWRAVAGLLLSVLLVLGFGDTLFFVAATRIGLVRAMPLSMTYPLFTFLLAAVFLGEHISLLIVAGALLILAGVYLLSSGPRAVGVSTTQQRLWVGIVLALLAALCWASGSVLLTPVTREIEPIALNAIREPAAALFVFLAMPKPEGFRQIRSLTRREVLEGIAGGVVGSGFGALLYVVSLRYAGAAISSALTASSPVFSTPLSMLLLGEKVSYRTGAGTALTIAGVWLVILS